MEKFSYSTFGVARTLMALAVFFCHVFEKFNYAGFVFVGMFFFMSGFGLEVGHKRLSSLTRLIPYIGIFLAFTVVYYALFRVFPYPSSWFFIVYFAIMVIYRFVPNIYVLCFAFAGLAGFFQLLDFNWGWYASFGAFLFGVFFARNPHRFTFGNCLSFFPLSFLLVLNCPAALWAVSPVFAWLLLKFCSLEFMRPVAFLGQYTLLFYCSHCLFLGLLGATWTLGGSPTFPMVAFGFFLTCVFSFLMHDGIIKR